jgi:hypothetical protein
MRRSSSLPLAAAIALALLSPAAGPPLAAQGGPSRGVGLGASVGANVPSGSYGNGVKTGLVVTGFAVLRATEALGVRGELFWSRSDIDNAVIRNVGGTALPSGSQGRVSGNVDLIGAEGNAVLSLGRSVLQPYLIGGVGVYRRRVAQDVSGTISEFRSLRNNDTNFGWNGGAGLRLSLAGLSAFAEARYHAVSTSPDRTTFVPVTVGLEF